MAATTLLKFLEVSKTQYTLFFSSVSFLLNDLVINLQHFLKERKEYLMLE